MISRKTLDKVTEILVLASAGYIEIDMEQFNALKETIYYLNSELKKVEKDGQA